MTLSLDALLDDVGGKAPTTADELEQTLTKQASNGDDVMSTKGAALADIILAGIIKQANNVIDETDQMVEDADGAIEDTPAEGSITEVAQAIADRAGVEEEDDFEEDTEDAPNAPVEKVAGLSSGEKRAHVEALMDAGYELEDAVAMVKQANELMVSELEKAASLVAAVQSGTSFEDAVASMGQYSEMEKAATVRTLVEEDGLSFADAIALVSEAVASPRG